jgi:hypothetical protein
MQEGICGQQKVSALDTRRRNLQEKLRASNISHIDAAQSGVEQALSGTSHSHKLTIQQVRCILLCVVATLLSGNYLSMCLPVSNCNWYGLCILYCIVAILLPGNYLSMCLPIFKCNWHGLCILYCIVALLLSGKYLSMCLPIFNCNWHGLYRC